MTISIILSVLAGMAIGLRFNVFMTLPTILLAALSTAATYEPPSDLCWNTVLAVILSVVGVQLGYLCGTFAQSIKEIPVSEGEPKVSRTQASMRNPAQ